MRAWRRTGGVGGVQPPAPEVTTANWNQPNTQFRINFDQPMDVSVVPLQSEFSGVGLGITRLNGGADTVVWNSATQLRVNRSAVGSLDTPDHVQFTPSSGLLRGATGVPVAFFDVPA